MTDDKAPDPPRLRLSVGVTGHRRSHPSYPQDDTRLRAVLAAIFAEIDALAKAAQANAPVRLCTLLADGVDEDAAIAAQALSWDQCVPLPFGRLLNRAISAQPIDPAETDRILAGGHPADPAVAARLKTLESIEQSGCLFEIAEQDAPLTALLRGHVDDRTDPTLAQRFAFETARRYALGARVVIEQCDLLIAVWDSVSTANVGGTGHTVREALHHAVPVLHIDPSDPDAWTILTSTEMLACPASGAIRFDREAILKDIVARALGRDVDGGLLSLTAEEWHPRSSIAHHAYRRVEALFGRHGWHRRLGSIRQTYELPADIASGSAAPVLGTLSRLDPESQPTAEGIARHILAPFAWADGVSTYLSDRYRSGMVVNFVLGSIAIIVGVLYLPLAGPEHKWIFATIELETLLIIVINTQLGRRRDLHARWFTARRAAEYLRQRPLMAAAGVARPSGQWPSGESSGWPELYVRMAVREVGLPEATITEPYLRGLLHSLLELQVLPQKDYHLAKSEHLNHVHHRLDMASEALFIGAIVAVSIFLALSGAQALGLLPGFDLVGFGKWVTVAGVAFPTIGGALAGIRYFGDFERFADISQVAARRLGDVEQRIRHLSNAAPGRLEFGEVADLLRATDEIVFDELESWQAVFSGKRIAVPV